MDFRLLKFVAGNDQFSVLIPAEGQEQSMAIPSEINITDLTDVERSAAVISSAKYATVSEASQAANLLQQAVLRASHIEMSDVSASSTNIWTETQQAAKLATDNMTRWLQHAEIESQKVNHSQQAMNIGKVNDQESPSPSNVFPVGRGSDHESATTNSVFPVRADGTKAMEMSHHTNIPLVARLETVTPKNKVVPILLNHGQILHLSDTTKTIASELPVDLRHVILLPKSQSENQSSVNVVSKNQLTTETATTKIQPVYSMVSPVYKSKLEKAIAQNQTIALSQGLAMNSAAKSAPGTLKRLLNLNNSESINRLTQISNGSQMSGIGNSTIADDVPDVSETLNHFQNNSSESQSVTLQQEYTGNQWAVENKELIQSRISTETNRPVEKFGEITRKSIDSKKTGDHSNVTAVAEYYKKLVSISKPVLMPQQTVSGSQPLFGESQPHSGLQPHSEFHIAHELDLERETIDHLAQHYTELETYRAEEVVVTPSYSKNNFASPTSLLTSQPSQSDELLGVIIEKQYEDVTLGSYMLDGLWKLRENHLFCDAVLLVGTEEIKLHKLVLSAVSPEIYKKAQKLSEPTLKLVLPSDIQYENVVSFVSYIYQGKLTLTVHNVQQLYRLSAVFAMDQLSKFCYDFCKLAKLGHLIISSPYQEAAKRVNEIAQTSVANTPKQTKEAEGVPSSSSSSSLLSPSPKQTTVSKQTTNKELDSLEIDWMTSDPTQSNIPIRKRGRTRKSLTSSGDSVNLSLHEEVNQDGRAISAGSQSSAMRKTENVHGNFENENSVIANQAKASPDIETIGASESEVIKEERVYPYSVRKDKFRRQQMIEEVQKELVNELPDPLATGKFDESELLRLTPVYAPTLERVAKSPAVSKIMPTKSMVTRFRGRPKNMTMLEAASNKKARNNDTAAVFASTAPTKGKCKAKNRKSVKSPKQKTYTKPAEESKWCQFPKSPETEQTSSPPENSTAEENFFQADLPKFLSIEEVNVPDNKASECYKNVGADTKTHMPKESTRDAGKINAGSLTVSRDVASDLSENLEVIMPALVMSVSDVEVASPPKKARLRRSTLEQQAETPLKDTVYMRPPPKKRAKEIREMMKNEADIEEEKTAMKLQSMHENRSLFIDSVDVKNESVKDKQVGDNKPTPKKPRKRTIKDEAIVEVVNEIEISGEDVEGDKQYRCSLCNNEFVFARRAITHLVSTHDVEVEETSAYITVEHKIPTKKVCDICGYQTKEVNIYYIHFHKYFRHGVPLPKGWKPFTCDLCKKEFFTKFQLREHKLIHFEDNPFVCEHCGSGFKSRTCLNSHVFHKHSTVRRHKCSECPKTFKTATQMKVHQRTHTGEKPFACPDSQCPYRSTTRGNMRLHLVNRHKFASDTVKELMNALQSLPATATIMSVEVWEHNLEEGENEHHLSLKQQLDDQLTEMQPDPDPLEKLVEAAAAEVANSSYVPSHMTKYSLEQNITTLQGTHASEILDQNQVFQTHTERGYDMNQGLVQSSSIGSNLGIVETNIDGHNIPRHVQMLIQETDDVAHNTHMLTINNGQKQILLEYLSDTSQDSSDMVPIHEFRHSDAQTFDGGAVDSRLAPHQQVAHKSRVLDPQSREARMIVKEAFQGHEPRSLLKAAILHGSADIQKPIIENVSTTEMQMIPAEPMYQDSRNLVPETVTQEHHILNSDSIHNFKSQVHEQYRVDNSGMFSGEHSNSHLTLRHHIQSQQQNLDSAHLQVYHQVSSSPPAYNSSTHGIISIPMSEISTTMAKSMFPTSMEQGQIQGHSVQGTSMARQNQDYDIVVTQPSDTVYENENGNIHVYQGFYQNYQNY